MGKIKRGRLEKYISFTITALILAGILIFGSVHAVNLYVHSASNSTPFTGDLVYFVAEVDILNAESVPIQNLTLTLNGTNYCHINPYGIELNSSESACPDLSFTNIGERPYGWANDTDLWGYGYGYNGSSWVDVNTSFGIGYGYGYTQGGYVYSGDGTTYGELAYNVTWNTTDYAVGTYLINLTADVNQGSNYFKYSSETDLNITVGADETIVYGGGDGGASGGGSDETETETETEEEEQETGFSGETSDFGDMRLGDERRASMEEEESVYFNLEGTEHSFTVVDLEEDSVTVEIRSRVIKTTFRIGETKNFDLDNNNINDISFTLNDIRNGKAYFTFVAIDETVFEGAGVKKTLGSNVMIILIVAVLIIIVVLALTLKKKRK